MSDFSVSFDAVISALSSGMSPGGVVYYLGNGVFSQYNSAAQIAGETPAGVMRTIASPGNAGSIQYTGLVPESVTGIAAGTAGFANVNSSGAIVRSATADATTLGVCLASGAVILGAGLGAGGGGGTGSSVAVSGPISLGDVVTSALDDANPTKVVRATAANRLVGGIVRGVVTKINGDGTVTIAGPGESVAREVTGLTAQSTDGTVYVNSTGGCVFTQSPAFGVDVVGYSDTSGILMVQPGKSRTSEYLINVLDYGATGLSTDDASPAIEAAIAASLAQVSSEDASLSQTKGVYFPPGAYLLNHPIRADQHNFELKGAPMTKSHLLPKFKGTGAIIVGPNQTARGTPDMPVGTGGPFSGNRTICNSAAGHFWDLRQIGAVAEFDGLSATTIEMWVRLETSQTGSNLKVIAQSSGLANQLNDVGGNVVSWSLLVLGGGIFSTADNVVQANLTIGGTPQSIVGADAQALVVNTWTHVAIDYDGTHFRLLVNGHVTGSTVTTSGTVTQKPWEGVFLGAGCVSFNRNNAFGNFAGSIGPVRFSIVSNYSAAIGGGTTYTVPSAKFSVDVNVRAFQDIFVCNWDQNILGDVYGATYAATDQVWMVSAAGFDTQAVNGFKVYDFDINGGKAGVSGPCGIYVSNCLQTDIRNIDGGLLHCTLFACNGFGSSYDTVYHNGSGYAGIVIMTTAGDVLRNCFAQNAFYPYYLVGGLSLERCSVGTWQGAGSGVFVSSTSVVSFVDCFWDAEATNDPTSLGALTASSATIYTQGILISQGGLADFPTITLDQTDADIRGFTFSGGAQTTRQLSIPRPPPHRIAWNLIDVADSPPSVLTPTPILTDTTSKVIVDDRNQCGRVLVSYASNADKTLTADAFTYHTIEIATGSLTSDKALIVPLLSGWRRTFANQTDYTITVIGSTGAGVEIGAQSTAELRTDGTNWYRTSEDWLGGTKPGVFINTQAGDATVGTLYTSDSIPDNSTVDVTLTIRGNATEGPEWGVQEIRRSFLRNNSVDATKLIVGNGSTVATVLYQEGSDGTDKWPSDWVIAITTSGTDKYKITCNANTGPVKLMGWLKERVGTGP